MNIFGSKPKITVKTLDEVQQFLSNIPSINCGGCGISALAMYRWLKKHGKTTEQTAFYYLENDAERHNNNKSYYSNKDIALIAPCHVVLYHNDQTIDCDGYKPISSYSYQLIEKSEEFLIKMINNIHSWNYSFNRKNHVKHIAKTLGIDLSDILIDTMW
jgi:hypothetical protein